MGIFTLGLLRGASQQYVRMKEAEAAQEAREKELADERAFQERMAEKQAEEQRLAQGRQQYWAEVNERNRQMFEISLQENNVEQQRRLIQERIDLEQEVKNQNIEDAIVRTFGYIAEDGPQKGQFVGQSYTGSKRLPDTTELGPELQRRVQKGVPTILPPVLGTIPGFDNLIKQNTSVSMGTSALTAGTLGADPDFSGGTFVLPSTDAEGNPTQTFIRIPAVDEGKGDTKSRARSNSLLVMKTLSQYDDLIPTIVQEYNRGEYDNYNTLINALKKNGGDALRESLKIAQTEGKDTVISNPIDFYGLLTHVKGKANQDWFAKNVIAPVFGYSVDVIKTLMGDPAEISYTYDQVNNRIIRPNPENWEWATVWDEDSGRNVIRQDIWKQVQEVSKYNGVPSQILLGLVKDHKKPLLALKDIADSRTELENTIISRPGQALQITEDGKSLITRKLAENNFDSIEDEILYVRSLVKDNPNSRPSQVAISATGNIVPQFANQKKLYQIDGKDARQMAASARRAEVIAGRMLELRKNDLGGVGLVATVTRLVGGARDIGDALMKLSQTYNMEPETAARFAENANLLRQVGNYDKIDMETTIQGQKVFDLLAEQLAFAMAAAVQGGEGGRAISDRDVEAQRAVLGLRGLLASNTGVEVNLNYLREEMGRAAVINEQYAKALDSEDFKAVYIYDQSIERSRTLDDLLTRAPQKFEETGSGNITPETHPDRFVKINGRFVLKAD